MEDDVIQMKKANVSGLCRKIVLTGFPGALQRSTLAVLRMILSVLCTLQSANPSL